MPRLLSLSLFTLRFSLHPPLHRTSTFLAADSVAAVARTTAPLPRRTRCLSYPLHEKHPSENRNGGSDRRRHHGSGHRYRFLICRDEGDPGGREAGRRCVLFMGRSKRRKGDDTSQNASTASRLQSVVSPARCHYCLEHHFLGAFHGRAGSSRCP